MNIGTELSRATKQIQSTETKHQRHSFAGFYFTQALYAKVNQKQWSYTLITCTQPIFSNILLLFG